jgi:glycosyltransferase involved in cell wall biosynthesis
MRASFARVEDLIDRPRWSVMIPTFNSTKFLRKTLESVLSQDPGPERMQIEVVDDASGDDPAALVDSIGGGRISFFRQPSNLGQIGNLNACIARARGEIVHLLHGDDFVLPGFYESLGKGFARDVDIGAAFCRWTIVDPEDRELTVSDIEQERAGRLDNALERLASEQRIVTPSIAVRRSAWEQLGGFDSRLRCAEDWEMWVRIAARYPIWYEPRKLAAYRRHDASTTTRSSRNAKELRYTKTAIKLFAPLLPADRRAEIVRGARRTYATTALANAAGFSERKDWSATCSNLLMAVRLDPSLRTIRSTLRVVVDGVRAK